MPQLLSLLLAAAILVSCPGQRARPVSTEGLTVWGDLKRDGSALSYSVDGGTVRTWQDNAALPYRVVAAGEVALVTTAGTDLRVSTWAVPETREPVQHYDLLPSLAHPPLRVLVPLTESPSGVAEGTVLLGADGRRHWSDPRADLLWAYSGADESIAYAAVASGDDLIFPYGQTPQLVAVDSTSGIELWRIGLEPASSTVDVQLWGLTTSHGLLMLQYDYEVYEFLIFERGSGRLGQRFRLAGQPAVRLVYPGPTWEPARVEVSGDTVSLAVNEAEHGFELWTFALAFGLLDKAALPELDAGSREDNSLPLAGGSAVTGAPMPQGLLPTGSGEQWSIPALVNAAGKVLVISSDKAEWR